MKIYTTEKHFPASKLLWAFSEIPPNFRFTKRAPFYYRLFIKCMKNTCEQPSMAFEVQFFFNENNWKLVLVITFRNQRMRKFCKKRWLQLDPMFIIHTEELLNSIKKRDFQRFFRRAKLARAPPHARIKQNLLYLLVFLILRMKNVHISCSAPSARVPLFFDLLFLERIKFWRPSFLQNCANRRFRWLMIVENFDKKSKNFRFFLFAYSVRSRRVTDPNGLTFKISSRYSRERTGQSWKSAIFKKSFFTSSNEFFDSFFI